MKVKYVITKALQLSTPFGNHLKGQDIYWCNKILFSDEITEAKIFDTRKQAIDQLKKFSKKQFYNGINDKICTTHDFSWMKNEMSYLKIEEIYINK